MCERAGSAPHDWTAIIYLHLTSKDNDPPRKLVHRPTDGYARTAHAHKHQFKIQLIIFPCSALLSISISIHSLIVSQLEPIKHPTTSSSNIEMP